MICRTMILVCPLLAAPLVAPGAAEARWRGRSVNTIDAAIAVARAEGHRCRTRVLSHLYRARDLLTQHLRHRARASLRTARLAAALGCSRHASEAIRGAQREVDGPLRRDPAPIYRRAHHGGSHNLGLLPGRHEPVCSTGEACNRRAGALQSQGRYRRAYALFSRACEVYGHIGACVDQGFYLEKGRGVPQDLYRSTQLYRRACNRGSGIGCNNLGVAYQTGRGVAVDRGRARQLYQHACRYGVQLGCKNARLLAGGMAMGAGAFASLVSHVGRATYSRDKLAVVTTAARRNSFTCSQVRQLIRAMTYSREKVMALRALAPRIVDRQNSHTIIGAFTYSSDKRQAQAILGG